MADITIQQPLSGELVPGLNIKKLITAILTLEKDGWFASDIVFGEYANGSTQEEVVANLRIKIAKWYRKCEANKESEPEIFEVLQKYIEEV